MLEDEINTHLDYAQEYVDFILRDSENLSHSVKEQMKLSIACGMLYDIADAKEELAKYSLLFGAVNLAHSAIEIGYIPGITPAPMRRHMVNILRSSLDVPHEVEPLDILERVINGIDSSLNPKNSYNEKINRLLEMDEWGKKYKAARKEGIAEYLKLIDAHNKYLKPKDIVLMPKESKRGNYTVDISIPSGIELPQPHKFNFEKENREYWLNACKELYGRIRSQFFRLNYSLN